MSSASSKFKKAALIGTGLIGSSLILAMRKAKMVATVAGFDRDPQAAARANEIGIVDDASSMLEDAVSGADLVIIATPVGAVDQVLQQVSALADKGTLIIDVGSVKESVAKAAEKLPDHIHFVPCHPVAGTEQSGPDAGFCLLYTSPSPRDLSTSRMPSSA